MSITIVGGGNPSGPTYPLQRSVRLRASATAYFSRTVSVAGNRKTWTWSGWVKRGALGSIQTIFNAYSVDQNNTTEVYIGASDNLAFSNVISGSQATGFYAITNAVFRDPSAWYHIVFSVDTTQSTAAAALKVYVNGVQQTIGTSSYGGGANQNTWINAALPHRIGQTAPPNSAYVDGYLTEVNFIDGQALTPTSFGAYNSYGVWSPAKYTGTYGTNGFYLNFQDNSAATAAAIGKDSSGNGNNWTPNNISVTAGVTYDSMLDVPTLTSVTNANFAVMNPLARSTFVGSSSNPSTGNLVIYQATTASWAEIIATMGASSGKWYWEIHCSNLTSISNLMLGVVTEAEFSNLNSSSKYVGSNTAGYGYYSFNGNKYNNGVSTAYGSAYVDNDIVGVALDMDAGTLTFYKNGVSQGIAFSGLTGTMFPAFSSVSGVGNVTFGQRPFTYTPPTGFKSLNTYNLPAPTIPNGAAYMAATTYTGNGSTQTITNTVNGTAMQPDLVWVKSRSLGTTNESYHFLVDSVRGLYAGAVYNYLNSNTTAYQNNSGANVPSSYGGVTTLNSNGFSVTGAGSGTYTNQNAATYVGWQWKANGATTVINTSGSIPSTVSANTTNGFSIVTWIGNNSAATIGHGLGVAPAMYFVKQTTATGDWFVYHQGIGATKGLFLELTNAATTNTYFNNTAPTSTVFSVGGGVGGLNATGVTQIAYCWAEIPGFSKFGSYTGNGSTDGTFVYTGFRPRFVLVKSSSAVEGWVIWDSSRNTYNTMPNVLYPNLSNAEGGSTNIDFLSNGFKLRNSATNGNITGVTYIYAAFAENPFNYSLAR